MILIAVQKKEGKEHHILLNERPGPGALEIIIENLQFLDAFLHFYKCVHPSVCPFNPSVGPSVSPSHMS